MIEWYINYDQVKKLFELYNFTGNRNTFVRESFKLEYELTERELSFIWQAFDMAAEEWQEEAELYKKKNKIEELNE